MRTMVAVAAAGLFVFFAPRGVGAHCDTLDGPVVKDARVALEAKDVTPVLKWVRPADEPEIREAFGKAVAVRAAGGEAAALASGSADALVRLVTAEVEKGLRARHARAAETRKHAGENVARGREYVAAYVDLMHYAERLMQAAGASAPPGEHGKPPEHAH